MSKENIRLIKYLGVIFIAVVLSYKIPHDSYSLSQYVIKPIEQGNSVLYLSGIIPLILFVIGIKGIWRLERFARKNRIIVALIILVFVIPFMKWTIDFARTNYHTIMNDGINSIDITESDIYLSSMNDTEYIIVSLKLKDYSRHHNKFRIRVYLPKTLSEYTGSDYYELENYYVTDGNNYIVNVHEQILVDKDNSDRLNAILSAHWYSEDVKYVLYDDSKKVNIIDHGY